MRRRDERGVSMIIMLALVVVIGLIIVAVFEYASTSFATAGTTAGLRAKAFAADGAANAAIRRIETSGAASIVLSGSTGPLAQGSTRTLTATIEDPFGNPITTGSDSSLSVTFSQTRGKGSVTGLGASTAANGVATIDVTGNALGDVWITASAIGSVGPIQSSPLPFTVVSAAAATIVLSGATNNLATGATRTLTATIEDSTGSRITSGSDSALVVTFSQTAGTGEVTGLGTATASAGIATITVTGSKTGPVSITASATGSGGPIQSTPLSFTVVRIVLAGSNANLVLGAKRTITATIDDGSGNPIVCPGNPDCNLVVTFTKSGNGSVTFAPANGQVTAAGGTATITLTGSAAGTVTISASATDAGGLIQSTQLVFSVVAAPAVLAATTRTGTAASATLTTVTLNPATTTNATVLVLVYMTTNKNKGTTSPTASLPAGPFTGATTQIGSGNNAFDPGNGANTGNTEFMWAFWGRADGTSTAVSVNVSSIPANWTALIDVLQLSGNDTVTPIVQPPPNTSVTNAGSATATATLSAGSLNPNDAELVWVAEGGTGAITPPNEFASVGALQQPGGNVAMVFDAQTATTSAVFPLGASTPWGVIAMEIKAAKKIAIAGSALPLVIGGTRAITATIQDSAGNTISTGPDSTLSVTFTQVCASGCGSVTGLGSATASAGVATITVTGSIAGTVSLIATATSSTGPITSGALTFNVVDGSAAAVVLTGSTANLAIGATRTLTATIDDSAGNLVTSGADANLAITFVQTSGTGTVTGLGTRTAAAGVASITVTGATTGDVTIVASTTNSAGTPLSSVPLTFTVVTVAGTASQVVITASAVNVVTGAPEKLTATIEDSAGNPISSGADSTLAVSFVQTGGSGSVTGLQSANAVQGVATITVTANALGPVTIEASVKSHAFFSTTSFTVIGANACYQATTNGLTATVTCGAGTLANLPAGDVDKLLTVAIAGTTRVQAEVVFHVGSGMPPTIVSWTDLR